MKTYLATVSAHLNVTECFRFGSDFGATEESVEDRGYGQLVVTTTSIVRARSLAKAHATEASRGALRVRI